MKEINQKIREFYSLSEVSYQLGVEVKTLKSLFGVKNRTSHYGVNDYFIEQSLLKKYFPLVIYALPPIYIPHDTLRQEVISQLVYATYKFNDYVKLKQISPKQIRYFYELKRNIIKYLILKNFWYAVKIQERKLSDNKIEKFIVFDFNVYGKNYGFHQKYDNDMQNFVELYAEQYSDIDFDKTKTYPYSHKEVNNDEFNDENVKENMNILFQFICNITSEIKNILIPSTLYINSKL